MSRVVEMLEASPARASDRLALVREQGRLLAALEAVIMRDESHYAAGSVEADAENDAVRMDLLEKIAIARDALKRLDAEDRRATLNRPERDATAALESANREKARDLDRRTAALIAGWWIRRNEALAALGELRDGRRLIEAKRAGRGVSRGLDVSR